MMLLTASDPELATSGGRTHISIVRESVARAQIDVFAPILRPPDVLEAQQVQLLQNAHISNHVHLCRVEKDVGLVLAWPLTAAQSARSARPAG